MCSDDVADGCVCLFLQTEHEGHAVAIHDVVHDARGDDLPSKRVQVDRRGEPFDEQRREVAVEDTTHGCLVDVFGQELLGERELGVGHDDGQFWRGEPCALRLSFEERVGVGERLEVSVEPRCPLEVTQVSGVRVEHGGCQGHGIDERLVLIDVVGEDEGGHVVGHLGEHAAAIFVGETAGRMGAAQKDLDVDFVVARVDPRRVVDGVGVDQSPMAGELDACSLRESEVSSFADDEDAQLVGVDTQRVVRPVAGIGVGFAARLHVRADAAVPQQVDRRLEDLADECRRVQCDGPVAIDAEGPTRLDGQRDRFGRSRPHPSAGRHDRLIEVVPRGCRQGEQPPTFDEGSCGIGGRVDEDMTMVERGYEAYVRREQHGVAEHVTGHVADPDDADGILRTAAEPPEMVLDRFPSTAGRDAHGLVVVAGGPTRGEGVTEPEPPFEGDAIRGVGERGGPLVGGDHEVGVVGIEPHRSRRGDDRAIDEVVRQIEERVDEQPVAANHLGLHRRTIGEGPAHHESAFRSGRNDHGVLDRLRLHETEHLGTEILGALRPPDAASRHGAHTQVHALHDRGVDEDFVLRSRERSVGDLLGQDLESEGSSGRTVVVSLIPVRPDGGVNKGEKGTDDSVLIKGRDAVQLIEYSGADPGGDVTRGGAVVGIERHVEECDETSGDRRVLHESGLDVTLAEPEADLAQVGRVGAQDLNISPRQMGGGDETVQAIVGRARVDERGERIVEPRSVFAATGRRCRATDDRCRAFGDGHPEIVHPDGHRGGVDAGGAFVRNTEAQVGEHGEEIGEIELLIGHIDLQAEVVGVSR